MQIKRKAALISVALSASALIGVIMASTNWSWSIGFFFVLTCFLIIFFAITVVIEMVITGDDDE